MNYVILYEDLANRQAAKTAAYRRLDFAIPLTTKKLPCRQADRAYWHDYELSLFEEQITHELRNIAAYEGPILVQTRLGMFLGKLNKYAPECLTSLRRIVSATQNKHNSIMEPSLICACLHDAAERNLAVSLLPPYLHTFQPDTCSTF